MTNEIPKPGIYRGVPFAEYLGWRAVSNSSMQYALKSMLHYATRKPIEETPPMRLGRLVHAGRFEPDLIGTQFAVMPAFEERIRRSDGSHYDKPKSTAAYRELVDEFESNNAEKTIVSQDHFDQMLGMLRAMANNRRATEYLTGGEYEVSIVAIDPVTGLTVKARIDHLALAKRRISDLKSTNDASEFESIIAGRSYHRQLSLYGDMLTWLDTGNLIDSFCIVAVESSDPFALRAAPLSKRSLQAGRLEYRRVLNSIADCQRTGNWPGYPSPDEWEIPPWALPDTMAVLNGQLVSF